jgi:hypothetical protein
MSALAGGPARDAFSASALAAGPANDAFGAPALAAGGPANDTLTAPAPPHGGPPGLAVSWTGGLTLAEVLSAADRHGRHRAGESLPSWGEVGCAGEGKGEPAAGPQQDELGEEAVMAALEDRGRVLPVAALGGHAIMAPGPDLAGWLACSRADERDDAALVTSITAWRKVTSWAQAQELQAVAELAWRRRCAGAVDACGEDFDQVAGAGPQASDRVANGGPQGSDRVEDRGLQGSDRVRDRGLQGSDRVEDRGLQGSDRVRDRGLQGSDRVGGAGLQGHDQVVDACPLGSDPVAELEAEFASNEVALALTLTQGSAENWMDLAVSLTRRLPATLAALSEGTIDLNRAKLIDHYTGTLDVKLARAVERRVLVRAGHQTTGQLRASLQRAVLVADPAAAERRRQEAEKGAWVGLFGDHDGTASLSGRLLPGAQAAAAWARICAMAKAMEAAGMAGGMDLLRAQVFVGLLLGTLPLIPPAAGAPDDSGPGEGGPGDAGPGDDGPCNGGPSGAGPGGAGSSGSGPGDAGLDGSGWDDRGPRDTGGSSLAARGPRHDADEPGDEDAPRYGMPGNRDPDADRISPVSRPTDMTGSGPLPAWPPIPLPGATPTPGCAGLARAGPADSHDRRGPPGMSPSSRTSASASATRPDGAGSPRLAGRAVLCVPWRTLAGWSSEPGELSRIGPVTAAVTRDLALAAAADVTCEWKVVVVGSSGRAVAVVTVRRVRAGARRRGSDSAPAAGSGQVRATPGVVGRITLTVPLGLLRPAALPTAQDPAACGVLAEILEAALLAAANAASARRSRTGAGDCAHEEASAGYRVPDSMRALVEARDQACGFPTCRQPAWRCEQDHTVAYRLGGATCPCNLSAECARHHRLKHLPSWRLDQPRPGILTWTTPARLTHTVTPWRYPA